jgi:hypothetical protein
MHRPLNLSLKDRVVCYFARDRMDSLLPETENMSSCLKHILLRPGPSDSTSSLCLAFQAVSLAAFSQKEHNHTASSSAVELYGQALSKTRLAILDPQLVSSNGLLQTVTLLFSYEVRTILCAV